MQNREQGQAPQPAEGAITVTRETFTPALMFGNMLRLWTTEQIREFHGMLSRRPECQPAKVVTSPNRYGVDVEYFRGELARLSASLDNRPPDELARYLQTLANAAKRAPTPVDVGPGSLDLDAEVEAAWNQIQPEAARIKIEEAMSYFRPAGSVGHEIPLAAHLAVWDCLVMAKSFLGEAPQSPDLEDARRQLKEWNDLCSPVLEYGQKHSKELGIHLGDSIFARILELMQEKVAATLSAPMERKGLELEGFDADGAYLTVDDQVPIWDAVSAYVATCGGDTSSKTMSRRRENAVVRVNYEITRMLNRRLGGAPRDSRGDVTLTPEWLKATAEHWLGRGVKDGTAQWAHGLHLIRARAEAVLNGSPAIRAQAAGAAPGEGAEEYADLVDVMARLICYYLPQNGGEWRTADHVYRDKCRQAAGEIIRRVRAMPRPDWKAPNLWELLPLLWDVHSDMGDWMRYSMAARSGEIKSPPTVRGHRRTQDLHVRLGKMAADLHDYLADLHRQPPSTQPTTPEAP